MDGSSSHAALMNSTYRHQRLIYDLTRRYYLLGRDRLVAELAPPPGTTVLEVACGTGRNLDLIGRTYPDCHLYGLDISDEMLKNAVAKLGTRAKLARADACVFDAQQLFGIAQFDRIVLSYSLSMIPDWAQALETATRHLAPGGELHVVDFGTQSGLPNWFRLALRAWLRKFHVVPRDSLVDALRNAASGRSAEVRYSEIFRGYAQQGVIKVGMSYRPTA